jgi:hypothetical protein
MLWSGHSWSEDRVGNHLRATERHRLIGTDPRAQSASWRAHDESAADATEPREGVGVKMSEERARDRYNRRRFRSAALALLGFLVLELFFFLGTALHRTTSRDFERRAPGKKCLADQPIAYACLLPTLCRRPETCSQVPGEWYVCCKHLLD